MTFVVTETCIRCKYTDCVAVCPVECFHEGPNFLVIDPEACIDCGVCVPECPVEAIVDENDLPPEQMRIHRTQHAAGRAVAADHRRPASRCPTPTTGPTSQTRRGLLTRKRLSTAQETEREAAAQASILRSGFVQRDLDRPGD